MDQCSDPYGLQRIEHVKQLVHGEANRGNEGAAKLPYLLDALMCREARSSSVPAEVNLCRKVSPACDFESSQL